MTDSRLGEAGDEVHDWVVARLEESLPADLRPPGSELAQLAKDLTLAVCADLAKCTSEDSEARDRGESHVFSTSGCVHAIAQYRVAHALVELGAGKDEVDRRRLAVEAKKLSETAKVSCLIEIHPEAEIGESFRIDHGTGVVIGQQVRIGRDCTLLQEVVLGAAKMDAPDSEPGPDCRRHPTIGDGVRIAGGCRVLGPITVHDGAALGPGCTIRSDVPAGCRVSLINQLQVTAGEGGPKVHGLRWAGQNRLDIFGDGLADAVPRFVDAHHTELAEVLCKVVKQGDQFMLLAVSVREAGLQMPEPPRLQLAGADREVIVIEASGLFELWQNCDEISRPPAAAI